MPHSGPETHILLGKHHNHPSAVTATLVGTRLPTARALLGLHGFEPVGATTMVMVRIDHEEPHYALQAAQALRARGVTVDIGPELLDDIHTEWTWANHPMHWLDRDEIREVSNDAQKIYDDIRHGRLNVHLHAHDGWTTVAVASHPSGQSIHLHGDDHLRVVATTHPDPAEAIAEFERLYGDAVRPGPAPATDTERHAETARTPAAMPAVAPAPPVEMIPVHAAGTGDHEALLNDFLESQEEWEKWRTWSDETTHAVHESLVLRAEFVHEASPDGTQWKIAAYENPVGERLWHATATTTVPVEIMRAFLDSLSATDAAAIAAGSQVTEATIWEAACPLLDADWEHTVDGRWIRWQAPGDHPAGVQFDAFAAQSPEVSLPAWTFWGGGNTHKPMWALHFSPHAAASVLQDVAFELAHGLTQNTVTDQPRRLNVLGHTESRAQPAPRSGSSRSR
ncbi:DUF317 domain-containing protein [Streptomyces sp. NPDC006704]|uniref:DUF317 domain-containing protein n=1 Tax=Streptomyces sp. NPDC006704 TaxID=3364760 RepID=UPI0036C5402D